MIRTTILLLLTCLCCVPLGAAEDILVADFESENYGQWQVAGDAFGTAPAAGTLANQMQVEGYRGERLVNSFSGGDGSTGKLTSPEFLVERKYLSFLIGGGGHAGETCLNLLLDGEIVRSETGPNVQAGGSERLEPAFWDVGDLAGKRVKLEIVDAATGGWGHVNVDHIVLTDEKPTVPEYRHQEKSFVIDSPYLVIPIKNGARQTELVLEVAGQPVRRYQTELATNPEDVDWYAFFTIDAYRGQSGKVTATRGTTEAFRLVRQAATVPGADRWYQEPLRPQFHFSQAVGWNNDPNGMVYLDGTWHLFFQHNPVGWNWGNMTWGHAVSDDLVHWRQLPNALFPQTMAQGACFSGGATVDVKNTAGWKTGDRDVLVAFLTDTGAGESIAYSTDGGVTFQWYEHNPVVKHQGRDPKVIWYAYTTDDTPLNDRAKALGGHWVMAVYDESQGVGRNIAFYTSVDLKQWTLQSHLPGYYECPEIFALPVQGDEQTRHWVVLAADAKYALGTFDGRTFVPSHEGKHQVHWGAYYASQTFDNAPDGRRIQIGWVRIATPGMPFNQTFSFPHELTLRPTSQGVRLFAQPVPEITKLHDQAYVLAGTELSAERPARVDVKGDLCDVRVTFEVGDAHQVGLDIGGNRIEFDTQRNQLGDAPLEPLDGRVHLQVLVDRNMMEICGNDGRVYITAERKHRDPLLPSLPIKAFAAGGTAQLVELKAYSLKSIWRNDE